MENQTAGFFEAYTFKPWSDFMSSWGKSFGDVFKIGENDKPFWSSANFTEIMDRMPLAYGSVKTMNEALTKGIGSYKKISDSYVRNMMDVAARGYALDMEILTGKEAEADKFLETLNQAYEDIATTVVDALKDTPFKGIKEVDEALKNSLDSLSDERKMARSLFKEVANFNAKIAKLSVSAMNEAMTALTDVEGKGSVSVESYKDMMDVCGQSLKQSMDILDLPAPVLSEYQESVDNAVTMAAKNLDVLTSLLEIPLRSNQAIGRSALDIPKFGQDIFDEMKEGKPVSQEEFIKRWNQLCETATGNFIESAHFNGSIPKFINVCTDYLKSVNEHYRTMMSLAYKNKEKAESMVRENPVPENPPSE